MTYFKRKTTSDNSSPGAGRRLNMALAAFMLGSSALVACSDSSEASPESGGGETTVTETVQGSPSNGGSTTTAVADRTGGDPEIKPGNDNAEMGDLSQVTEASVSDLCPSANCMIHSRDINHPTWGPTRIFSVMERGDAYSMKPTIAAVDSTGEVKWTFQGPETYAGQWQFATEAPDDSQTLIFHYNPGRYDGVVALIPTNDGFYSLPNGGAASGFNDEFGVIFYDAEVGAKDANGNYEIVTYEKDFSGGQSNADAPTYKHFHTWTGAGYEEQRPKEFVPPKR